MKFTILQHADVIVLQTAVRGKVRRICVSVQAVEQYVALVPGRRHGRSPRQFVALNRQLIISAARHVLAGANDAADFISVGAAHLQRASALAERQTWFARLRSSPLLLGLVSKTVRRGPPSERLLAGYKNEQSAAPSELAAKALL